MKFVRALNAVSSNIWAVLIIAAGVALAIHRQEGTGDALITLGVSVFTRNVVYPQNPKVKGEPNAQ